MPNRLRPLPSALPLPPESKILEYKRDLSSPESAMRALVAFANSAGGQLVIGVSDDLAVLGVEDPLGEQERLANLVSELVSPKLLPQLELVTIDDKTLVVANVALSNRRPHFIKKVGRREGTFVRIGASNRQADQNLINDLQRGTQDLFFDQLPVATQEPDDLDTEALAKMLARPVTNDTLRTLDLITEDQGAWVATNAGVLLVGKNREHVFPFAHVMCARFRGERRLDIFDRTEVHEHLPLVIDKVMDFLKKHAFLTAEFGDIRRRDVWSIPVDAIREVLINALVHASYSTKGSPIRVAFCDDRIEVDSPGGLMPGITVEDMIRGVSSIRNPTLARVFAEMGLMEKWGTGVPGVFAAVAADGLPTPEITELPGVLRVTVFIKNHRPQISPTPGTTRGAHAGYGGDVSGQLSPEVGGQASRDATNQVTDQVRGALVDRIADRLTDQVDSERIGPAVDRLTDQVSDQVAHGVGGEVVPRQLAILTAASGEPKSKTELLAAIGLTSHTYNVNKYLVPLLVARQLELTQPASRHSPTQRYRTTKLGQAVLHVSGGQSRAA